MKHIKRKLRSTGGFTLVETLCATVILILLCLIMNSGIQIAAASFQKETAEADTQLLLSTLTDALSDKLRYAKVTEEGGNLVSSLGEVSVTADGKVMVGGEELLPDGVYRHGKYAAAPTETDGKIVTVEKDDTGYYFTVKLKVQEASGGENAISAETELTVRCLNPPPKPAEDPVTPP